MALLTVYTIDFDGLDVSAAYVAAAASQEFPNDGRTFVHIINTNGSSRTCTFRTAGTIHSHEINDVTVTIAATTGQQMVGPFNRSIYNETDGNIDITWSATADVTIGVFKLP